MPTRWLPTTSSDGQSSRSLGICFAASLTVKKFVLRSNLNQTMLLQLQATGPHPILRSNLQQNALLPGRKVTKEAEEEQDDPLALAFKVLQEQGGTGSGVDTEHGGEDPALGLQPSIITSCSGKGMKERTKSGARLRHGEAAETGLGRRSTAASSLHVPPGAPESDTVGGEGEQVENKPNQLPCASWRWWGLSAAICIGRSSERQKTGSGRQRLKERKHDRGDCQARGQGPILLSLQLSGGAGKRQARETEMKK